jgi:hypothetical protein
MDPARLLQHRVDHLERHLLRQLAQVTRREPPSAHRHGTGNGRLIHGGAPGDEAVFGGQTSLTGVPLPSHQPTHLDSQATRLTDGLAVMPACGGMHSMVDGRAELDVPRGDSSRRAGFRRPPAGLGPGPVTVTTVVPGLMRTGCTGRRCLPAAVRPSSPGFPWVPSCRWCRWTPSGAASQIVAVMLARRAWPTYACGLTMR